MTTTMAIAFLGFILENNQLFAATLLESCGKHYGIVYQGSAYHRAICVGDKQYLFKPYLCSIFDGKSIDFERVANRDFVLSSTTFNYCKHVFPYSPFPSPFPIPHIDSRRIRRRRWWRPSLIQFHALDRIALQSQMRSQHNSGIKSGAS